MSELVGCWRLESVEYRVNGKTRQPFGPQPSGRLMYSADGYMSAILMKTGRRCIGFTSDRFFTPGLSPLARLTGLLRYLRAAAQGISYSGRYVREGNTVTHFVDIASYPDLQGQARLRQIRFDGERLLIEAQDVEGCINYLVWRRERSEQHTAECASVNGLHTEG